MIRQGMKWNVRRREGCMFADVDQGREVRRLEGPRLEKEKQGHNNDQVTTDDFLANATATRTKAFRIDSKTSSNLSSGRPSTQYLPKRRTGQIHPFKCTALCIVQVSEARNTIEGNIYLGLTLSSTVND